MKKSHTVTQKASDFKNFKEVMIIFLSNALCLSQGEKKTLVENSSDLSQKATLPDLITHLIEKKVELSLVEKLKEFAEKDAVLENTNSKIFLKNSY